MAADTLFCYLVAKTGKDQIEAAVQRRPLFELPPGDVLIQVACSSLNYKDAMAARGHRGVVKKFPHVPGIDAAGTVVESTSSDVRPGDAVVVTGYELGAGQWGGWAQYVRVPAEWVVPLPEGMTPQEAMSYGTAGLTAALSVMALQEHDVQPEGGPVAVTGATGGVGSLAVKLLSQLGYHVVAVSGKAERHSWLKQLGAAEVVDRQAVQDNSPKPLLSARWAGAVDTVGGTMLASLLRATSLGGCVTACGLVGGAELSLTVYPFILRGVTLAGIDSAWCPRARRLHVWQKLAGPWRISGLEQMCSTVGLHELDAVIDQMLAGQHVGRVVVDPNRS